MGKVVDVDPYIAALKRKKEREHDKVVRAGVQIAINLLEQAPGDTIDQMITCDDCAFFRRVDKKCGHKNGLPGKVYPEFFCPYASHELTDEGEDARFEMFEED